MILSDRRVVGYSTIANYTIIYHANLRDKYLYCSLTPDKKRLQDAGAVPARSTKSTLVNVFWNGKINRESAFDGPETVSIAKGLIEGSTR